MLFWEEGLGFFARALPDLVQDGVGEGGRLLEEVPQPRVVRDIGGLERVGLRVEVRPQEEAKVGPLEHHANVGVVQHLFRRRHTSSV